MVVKGLSPAAASSCFSSFFCRVVFLFPLWAVWQPTLHLSSAFSRSDELWCLRSFPPEFFGNLNAWRNLCEKEKRVDRESWCIFSPFTQQNYIKGIATLCQLLSKFCYFIFEREKLGHPLLDLQSTTSSAFTNCASGFNIYRGDTDTVNGFLPNSTCCQFPTKRFFSPLFFYYLFALLASFTCSPAGAWWWVCRVRESFSPTLASGSLSAGCSSSSAPAGTLFGPMWSSAYSSQLPRHIYYTDNHFGINVAWKWRK